MTTIELIGRLLFALVFFVSPAGVLRQVRTVVGAPPLRWMPRPTAIVVVSASCVMALVGALLVTLGLWPDLGALLIITFLVPVTLTMHRFWEVQEPGPRAIRRGNFLLNASLVGGALLYFCLVNQTQDVQPGILSHPLFGRI